LLDVPKSKKITKYAINLARRAWSIEELKCGIMDPQKKIGLKTKLDPIKVEMIQNLIRPIYPDRFEKVWAECRKSVNQMAQDLNKRRFEPPVPAPEVLENDF